MLYFRLSDNQYFHSVIKSATSSVISIIQEIVVKIAKISTRRKSMKIYTLLNVLISSCFLTAFSWGNNAKRETLLYKSSGNEVYEKDLSPAARQAIYEAKKMYFDTVQKIVEGNLLEQYVETEAKKSKKSRSEIEASLFDIQISEKDAKMWYEQNKARLGGRPFTAIKGDITQYLLRQEQEKKKMHVVSKVKKEKKFTFSLVEPKPPVIEIIHSGYPFKGTSKPKVTIVEFADYKCPHCKEASKILQSVLEKYKDKVKLVFLDFPLRKESVSTTIAEGGVCADSQNKFWEYHNAAFEQQNDLKSSSPEGIAKKIGLKLNDFSECMKLSKTKEKVSNSRREGERIGVQGTPAIFINGRKHSGYSIESITEEIEKIL